MDVKRVFTRILVFPMVDGMGTLSSSHQLVTLTVMTDEIEACAVGKEGEVIALLLEEYRTLRAEILVHIGGLTTLLAFVGVATVLLSTVGGRRIGTSIALIAAILVGAYFYVGRVRSIVALSRSIAVLERRVNKLAERAYGCDRPVLDWESGHQTEPLRMFSPIFRLLRKRLH